MPHDIRPHSRFRPLEIPDDEYDRLVQRKQGGWSNCADETEWLAKLHYLRTGFEAARLDRALFEERETRLVLGWLRRQGR